MANVLTKFARRNFGERRSFGSKLGRMARGKSPFSRKITATSIVARPAGRVVNMVISEGADALVLGGVMIVGQAALSGITAGAKAVFGSLFGEREREVVVVEKEVSHRKHT